MMDAYHEDPKAYVAPYMSLDDGKVASHEGNVQNIFLAYIFCWELSHVSIYNMLPQHRRPQSNPLRSLQASLRNIFVFVPRRPAQAAIRIGRCKL